MVTNTEVIIKPYQVERTCKSQPDIEQLVLKDVDTTEHVYTRLLIRLIDDSLPDAVLWNPALLKAEGVFSWDLFVMLKYRQDWSPSGYGLGEMLYGISLLPNEELTLELKTWETSKTQQDVEDSTDIRNVSDILTSQSHTNELTTGEETKTHEYVDAKAGFSGFGFSASIGGGWSEDITTMLTNFSRETQTRSQQATNEYRATHKVRLAVSREEGSERKTTRIMKNINQAHTLNVNFYEVLREYDVELNLYDISMVLLGAEPDLNKATGYQTWEESPRDISLGQMIRLSRFPDWLKEFTDRHGVSPIKILRKMWSMPLYDGPLLSGEWINPGTVIHQEDRESFQSTMLTYVRPTSGWIEPDEKGSLRWAYEVLPGQEKAVLAYFYQFLPGCPQQIMARASLAHQNPMFAYPRMMSLYAEAALSADISGRPEAYFTQQRSLSTQPLEMAETSRILVHGLFHDMQITQLTSSITSRVRAMNDQYTRLRDAIGVISIDGKSTWTATLPTQGVYADLALGVCSGLEDFTEIERQFTLEVKRLEIERLKIEVEKLTLEKELLEDGKNLSSVTITNPTDKTAVNLDITVDKTPAEVQFKTES
ncbi:MAG: hypothetical protein LUQ62_04410 [Methanomicrobiales archaeon]|nr:hypothetical protein [Methanomicrobiales archaeon]